MNNNNGDNTISNNAMTGEGRYKYDAFISYRHCDYDQYVAKSIHSKLESYKLPKKLRDKAKKQRIERVFRDKEELELTNNLEDYLVQALHDSEYLIVICSPKIKDSVWCKKEIETFKRFHGSKNVLPILVEGTIEESFPTELLWDNDKPIEPLAADVTGGKRAFGKKIKSEFFRLIAPMLGVSFDDLKQRHREAKLKRKLAVSLATTAIACIVGVVFAISAITIKKQNEIIKTEQAKGVARLAIEKLEHDDYMDGKLLAYEAVTVNEGIEMPYTAEGQKALTKALNVYSISGEFIPRYSVKMPGIISKIDVSSNGENVIIIDNVGNIEIWDSVHFNQKMTFDNFIEEGLTYNEDEDGCRIGFINDRDMYYISQEGTLEIYDVNNGKIKKAFPDLTYVDAAYCINEQYLVIDADYVDSPLDDQIIIYDIENDRIINDIEVSYLGLSKYVSNNEYFAYEVEYQPVVQASGDIDDDLTIQVSDDIDDDLAIQASDDGDDEYPTSVVREDTYIMNVVRAADGTVVGTVRVNAGLMYGSVIDEHGDLIVLCSEFDNLLTNVTHHVDKYSTKTGEKVWSTEVDSSLKSIELISHDKVSLIGDKSMAILNCKDGSIFGQHTADVNYVDCVSSQGNEDYVWFVSSTGNISSLEVTGEIDLYGLLDMSSMGLKIDCNDIGSCIWLKKFIYVIPSNQNEIVIYSRPNLNDCFVYADELYAVDTEIYGNAFLGKINASAINVANELGLDDYEHAVSVIIDKDNKQIYYSKNDGVVHIFDENTMEKLAQFNTEKGLSDFLGRDIYGNYYFTVDDYGKNHCYVTNESFEVIAEIDYFKGLSKDGKFIIIDDTLAYDREKANGVAYPIYTIDELIEIADETIGF